MNFKNPEYLLLLLLLPLLYYFKKRQKPASIRHSMTGLLREQLAPAFWKKELLLLIRFLVLLFLVLALARPRKGLKERSVIKPAIDIIMVMDVSTSMRALDFKPLDRMQAAKKAAMEFVKMRTSDRVGLVLFSGLPFLQCPLTLDQSAILKLIEKIEAGMIQVDGTAVGSGMALGLKYLEKSDARSRVMILLTDGANNAGDIDPLTAGEMAKTLDIKVYTIGCGKPGPAYIQVEHPFFGRQLVQIPDELDETTLKKIAGLTGGIYFRATSLEELEEIYKEINAMEKVERRVVEYYEYRELFYPLLLIGLFLLGIETAFSFWRRAYP